MSGYTPTTRDLRVSWVEMRADGNEDIEPAQAEFDRWFAEELRKAKEIGWTHRDTQAWGGIRPDNPYKEDK